MDCAAAFRVDADGLPLLRRPGGIVKLVRRGEAYFLRVGCTQLYVVNENSSNLTV